MYKNSDMSAMPTQANGGDMFGGLTKRELFCLHMGVADTGDKILDAIIHRGNYQQDAVKMMAATITGTDNPNAEKCAEMAVIAADEIRALVRACISTPVGALE